MAIRDQQLQQAPAASRRISPNCPWPITPAFWSSISNHLGKSMGGSSGVLLAIMFAAAGQAIKAGVSLPAALQAGLARMKEIGGAKTGDRTMIDAWNRPLPPLPAENPWPSAAALPVKVPMRRPT